MLPLFRAILNLEDDCVPVISLVTEPAIDVDFEFFSSDTVFENFKSVDDLQCKIAGPVLIPDKRIYRIDKETNEPFDLYFDTETVQGMADSFSRNLNNRNITIQHSGISCPVTITESWITGKPDKSEKFGYDLPEGTWFVIAKVESKDFFEKYVMSGAVKGFSIETKIQKQLIEMNTEKFAAFPVAGSDKPLEATALEVGADVTIDGQPAPDGEYQLEDGTKVTVAAGKIAEVATAQEEAPEPEEQAATPDANPAPAPDNSAIQDMVNQLVDAKMALIEERIQKLEDAVRGAKDQADTAMSKIEEFGQTKPAGEVRSQKMNDQLAMIQAIRSRRS